MGGYQILDNYISLLGLGTELSKPGRNIDNFNAYKSMIFSFWSADS